MKRLIIASTGLLIAAVLATRTPAETRLPCGERKAVIAALTERHGERRQAIGLGRDGSGVVEFYASPETGSWTILFTRPDGITCLIAAGEGFELTGGEGAEPGEGA